MKKPLKLYSNDVKTPCSMSPSFHNGVVAMREQSGRYKNGLTISQQANWKAKLPGGCEASRHSITTSGFTLVELAIVIVIIGLLVGGVLQGQELIHASKINGTISQVTEYRSALETFKLKYGYLPGDIPEPYATNYGFQTRGIYAGQGDGDGNIQGVWGNGPSRNGHYQYQGETCMVWVDLSVVKLIKGTFDACRPNSNAITFNTDNVTRFLPTAKIGNGNHFHIWSDNRSQLSGTWLTLSKGLPELGTTETGLTVLEAYTIDSKIDDGLPQFGKVNILYHATSIFGNPVWAGTLNNGIFTSATPTISTSCMDNNNVSGANLQYSISQNANAVNCALSIQLQ